MKTITSQLERIEAIVREKQVERDYRVQVVDVTMDDGEDIRLVIDGHHSHEAAIRDAAEVEWVDVTDDYSSEIEHLGGNGFLDAHNCGEGWWDLGTGQPVW